MTGTGGVGKTAITIQYMSGVFIKKYDPTIEESYRKVIELDGHNYRIELIDTAGTQQFTTMHDLYMKSGQGFIVVFSLISERSFTDTQSIKSQICNIKDTEIVPIVLVGNKSDLIKERSVSKVDAMLFSDREFGGNYFETSALTGENIKEVFENLIRQIIPTLPNTKKTSCILF